MHAKEITDRLIAMTAKNSRYETERSYVSLSHCALSVDEIIGQFQNGFKDTLPIRLKCYKGYQMEDDLIGRMSDTFGFRVHPFNEISAYDGIVKGHPDFGFEGDPGDCKSVLMDDWVPEKGRLPRKV